MVTTPTTQITLLSAVNEMLAAVGTAQVTTLDAASTNEEVQKALNSISDVAVQVQSERWNWNTDEEFPLNPDPVGGTISLPANSLWRGLHWRSGNRKAAARGTGVYDLVNHTFQWAWGSNGIQTTPAPLTNGGTGMLGVLYANLSFYFPFEQLPQPVAWLVLCRAARMFAVGRVPDSMTFKFTDAMYEEAYALAKEWDNESTSAEYYDNPHLQFMGRR